MSVNFKEMSMFCEEVYAEDTEEKWQDCCSNMKLESECWHEMTEWMTQSTASLFT
jgi:hypothetical protein